MHCNPLVHALAITIKQSRVAGLPFLNAKRRACKGPGNARLTSYALCVKEIEYIGL